MSDPSESPATSPGSPASAERMRAIPARHPWRWVATALLLFAGTLFVFGIATNKNFEWSLVWSNFTAPVVLHGLVVTLELTVAAMAIGVVLGVILAVMRLSPVPVVSGGSWLYIWFFRGTPLLLQLLFWYHIALLTGRQPAIGIPLTHVVFFHVDANTYITAFTAAVLGLGLNEGAYMAEIVRAGILSVDEGQVEAAKALGMTRLQTMRLIVLPQAMRVIIPPTGNETISMLKTSSLASTIALQELLGGVQTIYNRTFKVIPLLIVASLWYLLVTSMLTVGQFYVERHFSKGATRTPPATPLQRLRALFARNVTRVRPQAPPVPPVRREGR